MKPIDIWHRLLDVDWGTLGPSTGIGLPGAKCPSLKQLATCMKEHGAEWEQYC